MPISDERHKLAQQSEKNFWGKSLRDNPQFQDKTKREYWQRYIDLLKRHVDLNPGDKILDIGCGPCGLINQLSQEKRYGLDSLIDYYLKEFDMPKEVNWVRGYGENIPFKDNLFDIVICTNVLDHTQDPEMVLAEINRILKEDRFLLCTVSTYSRWLKQAIVLLEKINMGDILHPYTFTSWGVEAIIKKAGFKTVGTSENIGALADETRRMSPKLKNELVKALDILKRKEYKRLVKGLIRFLTLFPFRGRQEPKKSIFVAIKS